MAQYQGLATLYGSGAGFKLWIETGRLADVISNSRPRTADEFEVSWMSWSVESGFVK